MKEYKVTYGGLPESSKKITAASANEAAKEFFLANPEKKHIFVNVNMFKEEIFKWTDFEGIESPFDEPKSTERINKTIVRTYEGSQSEAAQLFQVDAAKLEKKGYFPTNQNYTQGEYGCGAFLLALVLCILVIGILVFIYMLIVKPKGSLTVTYEYRGIKQAEPEEKVCPRCAETIKFAAKVCRFCGHEFEETNKLEQGV